MLTEPSIVHKEREILDELRLKFKMPKFQVCSKRRESNRRKFGLTKMNLFMTRRRRRQTHMTQI